MKEYDLYVPTVVQGKPLSALKLTSLKNKLIKQFGGLTYFPQKNKGFWRIGSVTFEDDIVIIRVLSDNNADSFWKKLRCELKTQWSQQEILIVVRQVTILK